MDSSACASRLEKGERGAAELSLQRHGRSIDEWSIKVLTALALMTCYHNSHTPSLMCRRRAGHSAPRR